MKYLCTGGSGKLGTELRKYLKGEYPNHQELDVTRPFVIPECDVVIHMASYTNVDKAEEEPFECFRTNVLGTYRLLEEVANKPFVFISSEHSRARGVYFESKLIGEMLVENLTKHHLIIRTLFKPNPWPWKYAFTDQITQGDYVDVIAPLIAKTIQEWDFKSKNILVGTGRKSIFNLAKRTRPDVKPNSVKDLGLERPSDYL